MVEYGSLREASKPSSFLGSQGFILGGVAKGMCIVGVGFSHTVAS